MDYFEFFGGAVSTTFRAPFTPIILERRQKSLQVISHTKLTPKLSRWINSTTGKKICIFHLRVNCPFNERIRDFSNVVGQWFYSILSLLVILSVMAVTLLFAVTHKKTNLMCVRNNNQWGSGSRAVQLPVQTTADSPSLCSLCQNIRYVEILLLSYCTTLDLNII